MPSEPVGSTDKQNVSVSKHSVAKPESRPHKEGHQQPRTTTWATKVKGQGEEKGSLPQQGTAEVQGVIPDNLKPQGLTMSENNDRHYQRDRTESHTVTWKWQSNSQLQETVAHAAHSHQYLLHTMGKLLLDSIVVYRQRVAHLGNRRSYLHADIRQR